MKWFKHPEPSLDLEPFDGGLAVLRNGDEVVGHVATVVGTFATPFRPVRPQPWVWFIVVWSDGTRERPIEDYPPWTFVTEMINGSFDWTTYPKDPHAGVYSSQWLPASEAARVRDELGIRPENF